MIVRETCGLDREWIISTKGASPGFVGDRFLFGVFQISRFTLFSSKLEPLFQHLEVNVELIIGCAVWSDGFTLSSLLSATLFFVCSFI